MPVPSIADLRKADDSSPFKDPPKEYNTDLFYSIDPENWYKTFPFAFEIIEPNSSDNEGGLLYRFFLPIPPQNYTIQDMSTSEAHATIGGVVEEVSVPVFSMITLVGTTGLSLNNPGLGDGTGTNLSISSRKILDEVLGATSLGGKMANFGKTIISNVIDVLTDVEQSLPYQNAPSAVNTPLTKTVTKLFDETTVDNGYKNFIERQEAAVRALIEGPKVPNNEFTNGWAWSHALRQFFLIYQRERANNPNLELWFADYKSRATYRCVPRSIQFQQNANAPYLINYTIILKCWQLEDSETEYSAKDVNRFQGDLSEVMTTSITGVISKIGKINNVLNRTPSVAGSFLRNSTSSFL